MRVLFAAILLALSTHLTAAESWVEPVAPTSQSFVKLHLRSVWPDGCVPHRGLVTRSANIIDVRWSRRAGCSGISVPMPWVDDVAIGVLEPGTYELRSHVDDDEFLRREALVVMDASPAFRVEPATVSVAGGETITIWRDSAECSAQSDVTIGGAAVPVVRADCTFVTVTVPPHAAGAVDVTAKFGEETLTTRAALRYVDPAATPDDSAFERVLVPLLYDGPGAYGSQWVTEGRMFVTETEQPLRWIYDVVNAECAIGPCTGPNVDLTRFGNHPAGLLLFVPRDLGDVEAKLFVRDTSRQDAAWGAQVPVVREKDFVRERAMRFPDVPFTAPYRALLRIYGVDAASSHVRIGAGNRAIIVALPGTCGFYVRPCNSARPAFVAIDLLETFPELAGAGRFTVRVTPQYESPLRYWSFVSITNNETQHVSLLTP